MSTRAQPSASFCRAPKLYATQSHLFATAVAAFPALSGQRTFPDGSMISASMPASRSQCTLRRMNQAPGVQCSARFVSVGTFAAPHHKRLRATAPAMLTANLSAAHGLGRLKMVLRPGETVAHARRHRRVLPSAVAAEARHSVGREESMRGVDDLMALLVEDHVSRVDD